MSGEPEGLSERRLFLSLGLGDLDLLGLKLLRGLGDLRGLLSSRDGRGLLPGLGLLLLGLGDLGLKLLRGLRLGDLRGLLRGLPLGLRLSRGLLLGLKLLTGLLLPGELYLDLRVSSST